MMPDASLLERARAWVAGATPAPLPPAPVADAPVASVPASEPVGNVRDLAVSVTAALCRRFEGFYPTPYLCPAGVPTIGYGATHYIDGRRVQLTDPPISRTAAERLLLLHLERVYLPAVLTLCPNVTDPHRLAALIDFTFNLGAGQLRGSTLRKRVNAERWDDVPTELRKWVKGGGKVLRGLVLRREAECELI